MMNSVAISFPWSFSSSLHIAKHTKVNYTHFGHPYVSCQTMQNGTNFSSFMEFYRECLWKMNTF